jgi:hypothetical protein
MLSQAGPTVALVRLGGLLVRAQRNERRVSFSKATARDCTKNTVARNRDKSLPRPSKTQTKFELQSSTPTTRTVRALDARQRPSGPRSQVHRRQTREGHHQDSAVAKNVRIQVSVHGVPTAPPWQVRGARDSAGLLDSIRLALLNLTGVKLGAVWRVGSVFNPARR